MAAEEGLSPPDHLEQPPEASPVASVEASEGSPVAVPGSLETGGKVEVDITDSNVHKEEATVVDDQAKIEKIQESAVAVMVETPAETAKVEEEGVSKVESVVAKDTMEPTGASDQPFEARKDASAEQTNLPPSTSDVGINSDPKPEQGVELEAIKEASVPPAQPVAATDADAHTIQTKGSSHSLRASIDQPKKQIILHGHPPCDENKVEADGSRPAIELPDQWSFLPFLCLPDGAHASEEEFIYFHLPPVPHWSNYNTTLFGLACFRQIPASELLIKTKDITRSTVQKAVVVLATEPILGSVRTKLGMVTQAFFAQRDFSKMELLDTLYSSLSATVLGPVPDSTLYTGISLRELVNKFKQKTLQLFKLMLLQKRYGLVSLIPDLLRCLQDVGSPTLSNQTPERIQWKESHNDVHESSKSRYQKLALPLKIFGEGAFFQPYIPLQQIDVLMNPETKSFMVGTSNSIFTHHKACHIDVVVNVDTGILEIADSALNSALSLTSADKRFMDADPSLNQQIEFEGSDEDIRSKFENYLVAMIVSVKTMLNPPEVPPPQPGEPAPPKRKTLDTPTMAID
ncbi:late secretory pathway protein avl9 [Chytridiales sp. JEL 0842]|nr:late secretory pathway protein avl9 [Chytridiales sp. JEL 0842]